MISKIKQYQENSDRPESGVIPQAIAPMNPGLIHLPRLDLAIARVRSLCQAI